MKACLEVHDFCSICGQFGVSMQIGHEGWCRQLNAGTPVGIRTERVVWQGSVVAYLSTKTVLMRFRHCGQKCLGNGSHIIHWASTMTQRKGKNLWGDGGLGAWELNCQRKVGGPGIFHQRDRFQAAEFNVSFSSVVKKRQNEGERWLD